MLTQPPFSRAQKFKVGAIRSFGNVLAYVSDFAGHWAAPGEEGARANAMFENRVVFAPDTAATYHSCSWTGAYAYSNTLYGPDVVVSGSGCPKDMTLAQWQALDPAVNDVGSSYNATRPSGVCLSVVLR